MKKIVFLITILLLSINALYSQTIWSGPTTTFTKVGGADWTLEANQDRITDNVWITRASSQGIFNIVTEANYTPPSPADTEWAFGTTADIGSLTFDTWVITHGNAPSSMINENVVLHLITDDIYIDITFLTFTNGGAGAGFSYERSTPPPLSTKDIEIDNDLYVFPNPSNDFISISGLTTPEPYTIYNMLGVAVGSGIVADGQKIDVANLPNAVYGLKFDSGKTLKFVKR